MAQVASWGASGLTMSVRRSESTALVLFFKITATGPVTAGRAVRRKLLQRPEMVPSLIKCLNGSK